MWEKLPEGLQIVLKISALVSIVSGGTWAVLENFSTRNSLAAQNVRIDSNTSLARENRALINAMRDSLQFIVDETRYNTCLMELDVQGIQLPSYTSIRARCRN